MLGPKQRLLASYVANADDESLDAAGGQWSTAETLLRRLSQELQNKASSIGTDERFSGESATAASQAFAQSATKMSGRADQMRDGSAAFQQAAHGVRQARKASDGFAKQAGSQPPQQPPDLTDAAAQRDYQTQNKHFWNGYNSNESDAGDAITALSANHKTQAAVFAKIHGETPPSPPSSGGGGRNPVTAGTAPTTTHVPGGKNLVNDPIDLGPGHHDPTDPTGPTHHTHPTGPTGPTAPTGPGGPGGGGVDPGVPQGPGTPGTAFPVGPGVPGPIGGAGSLGGGAGAIGGVGAVAGGALGGAAAAGLAGGLASGVNGGLNGLVPLGGGAARGSLSASGVRGIGASSRTGVGSVLGRSSGATGRAGAGGMSSRNGGGRGAGSRGSRGRAGSRGAGAGAGAGRKGKDRKGEAEERDLFDDGADWVDDEDIAPGLID